MSEGKRVKVVDVHQSPLNASRWLLSLDCGHELWLTATTKPKRTAATCTTCEAKP